MTLIDQANNLYHRALELKDAYEKLGGTKDAEFGKKLHELAVAAKAHLYDASQLSLSINDACRSLRIVLDSTVNK